jgi:hypothetical protein
MSDAPSTTGVAELIEAIDAVWRRHVAQPGTAVQCTLTVVGAAIAGWAVASGMQPGMEEILLRNLGAAIGEALVAIRAEHDDDDPFANAECAGSA